MISSDWCPRALGLSPALCSVSPALGTKVADCCAETRIRPLFFFFFLILSSHSATLTLPHLCAMINCVAAVYIAAVWVRFSRLGCAAPSLGSEN